MSKWKHIAFPDDIYGDMFKENRDGTSTMFYTVTLVNVYSRIGEFMKMHSSAELWSIAATPLSNIRFSMMRIGQ